VFATIYALYKSTLRPTSLYTGGTAYVLAAYPDWRDTVWYAYGIYLHDICVAASGSRWDVITCAIHSLYNVDHQPCCYAASSQHIPRPTSAVISSQKCGHCRTHKLAHLVPFSSYLTLKNIVTLKSRLGVTQGHWKFDRSHTSSYSSSNCMYYSFFANPAFQCNLIVNRIGNELKTLIAVNISEIIINDELKWNLHIENIYKKIMKHTSIFYKLRDKLPSQMLREIYYAFIPSRVLYGVEIYANTKSTYLDKILCKIVTLATL